MHSLRILERAKHDCNVSKILAVPNSTDNKSTLSFTGEDFTVSGSLCPRVWDGILCWDSVPANTTARVPCPAYLYGFDTSRTASKFCTENGTWYFSLQHGQLWTNYSQCITGKTSDSLTILEPHLPTIKLISKIGYTVSFISLLIAFTILASVKKLRCPRNNLHLHLFMSFIFRALAVLVKDAIFVDGVGLSPDMDFSQNNVDCKVFTSFWHYVLMANYCWILMEGLYLHSLVFLAFFTDSSSILRYVTLGWGLPVIFLVPWIIVRATLEDILCWTTNDTKSYFWIIRGPITISIIVSFILFVNITRVLFVKLFTTQTQQARKYRYRKWFKSTLVLVPLFGAHYAFLLGMSLAAAGDMLELVWLYIDQLFSSFQGFLVATLYCFLNTEVGAEARPIVAALRGACLPRARPSEPGGACCASWCRRREVRPVDGPATGAPRGRLSLLARSITLMTRVEERPPKQDFDFALQQVT
ncbi:parathyroid hormone/parathyroid hormone-related peptide receptor-like isoform X1 [Dermacentor andersoni]|uniref:parathyroid hormone/parathyroid hormone-related peptide receptor-like isoform X1 n=1 Tax=Dermacentor andersoni TaxID=34620 RepID=UPI002417FA3D|nr:parathyroid hormone/parathyroid hormone-related peptide receptor-like isoform X1 [Dermacentor andersoni]